MLLHGRWLAGSARMGRCDRLGHAKLCEARGDCREAAVSEISWCVLSWARFLSIFAWCRVLAWKSVDPRASGINVTQGGRTREPL